MRQTSARSWLEPEPQVIVCFEPTLKNGSERDELYPLHLQLTRFQIFP
jgi:hypothetical protein